MDAEQEAGQAAGSTEKGREQEIAKREATAWTDDKGEADKKEMAAMRAEYQRDPAAVEATWDSYGSLGVEGMEGGTSNSYQGSSSEGW
jgi:hypothetical protein